MAMPKPTEAHRRLERWVGRWVGVETMHPSQWTPEGYQAHGSVDNQMALNGFVVIQEYQQRRGEENFCGHGVFFYDPPRNQYVMHWWDSMGYPPNVFDGDLSAILSA